MYISESLLNFLVVSGNFLMISLTNASLSFDCSIINCSEVCLQIFKKALHAIYMMPGNSYFINSNNFFMTVFRKVQLFLRKVGYWPTTYMIQEAITALFSFPFLDSHNCSKILRALMKKWRSYLSWILPHNEPMIHESELSVSKLNLYEFCC